MFDFNYPDDAKFTTKVLPFRKVKGSEQLAKLDITPSWTPIWDFKSLAIFLNQCTNFKPIKPRANRIVSLISEKYREFKFECKILDSIYIMIVQVFPQRNFSINVFFSTNYVFTDDWKEIEERKFFFRYELDFPNLNPSSEAIINYKPLGFYNSTDFSEIFFYFTEKITNIIPNNKFTSFLFEFADTFIKRPNYNSIPDTKFLSKQTQGFLRIFYTLKNIPKLANFDNDKYALSGIYISPYAKSILEKKNLLAV